MTVVYRGNNPRLASLLFQCECLGKLFYLLFLRSFYEKSHARAKTFFLADFFSCFPVDSNVNRGDFIYIAFNKFFKAGSKNECSGA